MTPDEVFLSGCFLLTAQTKSSSEETERTRTKWGACEPPAEDFVKIVTVYDTPANLPALEDVLERAIDQLRCTTIAPLPSRSHSGGKGNAAIGIHGNHHHTGGFL